MKEVLRFDGVCTGESGRELFNINFTLFEGETLGLFIRDKYYSRSLVKLLRGIAQPARGRIYMDDTPVCFGFDSVWRRYGVYTTWNENRMIPSLSVAENIFMVSPMGQGNGIFRHRAVERQTRLLLERYGLADTVSPGMLPLYMTGAQCQIINILKCVAHGARVLVVDNIFHLYTPQDFAAFFAFLRRVKQDGVSIILLFNSWNPHIVNELARVGVVRGGTIAAQVEREDFARPDITTVLAGEAPPPERQPGQPALGREMLAVRSLRYHGAAGPDFTLCAGEVLGLFDADGYAGEEYSKALCGQTPCTGQIEMDGVRYDMQQVLFKGGQNIGFVPMNDCRAMILDKMSLLDNVTLTIPSRFCGPFSLLNNRVRRYMYQNALRAVHAEAFIATPEARGKSVRDPEMQLRLLCAKFICRGVKLLLLANPQYIYDDMNMSRLQRLLEDLGEAGMTVVVLSTSAHLLEKTCTRTLHLNQAR